MAFTSEDPFGDPVLVSILHELIDHGFALPVHCTVVGVNGSVSATVIRQVEGHDDLTCARTVEHVVDGRFGVPINVFFVDSRGEAVRILLGKDGVVELRN